MRHPTTTLEDLFLKIVEESKSRPGRRYLPPTERGGRLPDEVGVQTDGKSTNVQEKPN